MVLGLGGGDQRSFRAQIAGIGKGCVGMVLGLGSGGRRRFHAKIAEIAKGGGCIGEGWGGGVTGRWTGVGEFDWRSYLWF